MRPEPAPSEQTEPVPARSKVLCDTGEGKRGKEVGVSADDPPYGVPCASIVNVSPESGRKFALVPDVASAIGGVEVEGDVAEGPIIQGCKGRVGVGGAVQISAGSIGA